MQRGNEKEEVRRSGSFSKLEKKRKIPFEKREKMVQ